MPAAFQRAAAISCVEVPVQLSLAARPVSLEWAEHPIAGFSL